MSLDAEQTAALMALRRQAGRRGEYRDAMIAGIVECRGAQLATGNTKHLKGWTSTS